MSAEETSIISYVYKREGKRGGGVEFVVESHREKGNKGNKNEEIKVKERQWVGRQPKRATGVKRGNVGLQYYIEQISISPDYVAFFICTWKKNWIINENINMRRLLIHILSHFPDFPLEATVCGVISERTECQTALSQTFFTSDSSHEAKYKDTPWFSWRSLWSFDELFKLIHKRCIIQLTVLKYSRTAQ